MYRKHIKVLSLPNNFFINPGDFCFRSDVTVYRDNINREKEKDETTWSLTPIKILIIRETTDNPDLYNFKFYKSELENYKQVFGDTVLYIHKKHLRTLDDKIGSHVFKAIKPLEDLPEEYSFLLVENKTSVPVSKQEKRSTTKEQNGQATTKKELAASPVESGQESNWSSLIDRIFKTINKESKNEYQPNYTKSFIGVKLGDKPSNFFTITPQKKAAVLYIKVKQSASLDKAIRGFTKTEIKYSNGGYSISLTSPDGLSALVPVILQAESEFFKK